MLEAASEMAASQETPRTLVGIFDPRFYDQSNYGRVPNQARPAKSAAVRRDGSSSRRCNGRRTRLYTHVLKDRRRGLGELDTDLRILYGRPE